MSANVSVDVAAAQVPAEHRQDGARPSGVSVHVDSRPRAPVGIDQPMFHDDDFDIFAENAFETVLAGLAGDTSYFGDSRGVGAVTSGKAGVLANEIGPTVQQNHFDDPASLSSHRSPITTNSVMPVATPIHLENQNIDRFLPTEQIPMEGYKLTTPVIPRASNPEAVRINYGDSLLKAASARVRAMGSEAATAATILGPDVLNSHEASISGLVTVVTVTLGMRRQGAIPGANFRSPYDVRVIGADQYNDFSVANPGFNYIYLPSTFPPGPAAALVTILAPGGPGALEWRFPETGLEPFAAKYHYPVGGMPRMCVVHETGIRTFNNMPVGGAALTMNNLEGLLNYLRINMSLGAFFPEAYNGAAALLYGYAPVVYGNDNSAGEGLRFGTTSTVLVAAPANAHNGIREGMDLFVVPPARNDIPQGPEIEQIALAGIENDPFADILGTALVDAFGRPRAVVPPNPEIANFEDIYRRRLAYRPGSMDATQDGVTFTMLYEGAPIPVYVNWVDLRALVEGEIGLAEIGQAQIDDFQNVPQRARALLRALYVSLGPGEAPPDYEEPVEYGQYPIRNTYGQIMHGGMGVGFPTINRDGIYGLIAGITTLHAAHRGARKSPSVQSGDGRLLHAMRNYASRLHALTIMGMYSNGWTPDVLRTYSVNGASIMHEVPSSHRSVFLPGYTDAVVYQTPGLEMLESSLHIKRARNNAPYIGFKHEGTWETYEGGAVKLEGMNLKSSLPALDSAVRYTYHLGMTLAIATRLEDDRQITVMRSQVTRHGRNVVRALYHPCVLPRYVKARTGIRGLVIESDGAGTIRAGQTENFPHIFVN